MQIEQTHTQTRPAARAQTTHPILDWTVALGSLWLIIGLHLDGWAHHHQNIESFFTPWHAVLYSGFLFTAAAVALPVLNALRRELHLRAAMRPTLTSTLTRVVTHALPRAYRFSLLGALIFAVGGLGDMLWHTLLGIEVNIEALLSPPHLVLALGAGLLVSGPLRAAMARSSERLSPGIPALLSTAALWGMLAFFTAYANPWIELTDRVRAPFLGVLPGFGLSFGGVGMLVAAVLLQSALMMGIVLVLARRFRLPFGALTLLFTLVTAMGVSQHANWGLVSLALLGGLAADGLVQSLRPGERAWRTQTFAFLVPAMLYGLFFGALKLSGALDWSIQLWTGTVLLAGVAGWLLSMLAGLGGNP